MPAAAAHAHQRFDLSAQDAAFRPATVKQKIKQWQGEGGRIVTSPPPSAKPSPAPEQIPTWSPKRDTDRSRSSSPTKYEPFTPPVLPLDLHPSKPIQLITDPSTGKPALVARKSPPKKKAKERVVKAEITTTTFDPERLAWVRKTVQRPHNHDADEVRAATSPKKRVVSDSHWRNDKTASKPSEIQKYIAGQQTRPAKKVAPQKSMPEIRTKPRLSPHAGAWAVRKPVHPEPRWTILDPSKELASSAQPSRTTADSSGRKTSRTYVVEEQGIRESTQRQQSSWQEDSTRKFPRITPPSSLYGDDDDMSLASPDPDDSISRAAVPKSAPQRISTRNHKRAGHTRTPSDQPPKFSVPRVFSKQDVPATDTKPDGRIETWLGGTPDPFWEETSSIADETTRSLKSPIPEPLNLKKQSARRRSCSNRKPLSSAEQNRQFSFEVGDESVLSVATKRSPKDKENESARKRSSLHRKAVPGLIGQDDSVGLGIALPRLFPTTGQALSTIASEATFDTRALKPAPNQNERMLAASNKHSAQLQRSLTKHDDLMSVLSAPNDAASLVSASNFKSKTAHPKTVTMDSIMHGLAEEEAIYHSQLQTLVDDVVPLLLSSVLTRPSKTPTSSITDITRPVVDMGVALERLKSQHKRILKTNVSAFLIWAQNVAKIYDDYIKAWRMGFDDSKLHVPVTQSQSSGKISRNAKGVLVDTTGEAVDIAFLLKRPLVRIKSLNRTIRAIDDIQQSNDSDALSMQWQDLVRAAKKKSNDELARIEDEAAAGIDATRARDPRSLAPLAGVRIDPSRSVRARDYFELTLRHSTGQRLDCAIEIIIRDNEANPNKGGDLLICEVSDAGRWLLFPPIIQEMASARPGKDDRELLVMIRGVASDGSDWSEVLSIIASTAAAVDEWADMLIDGPTPPSPTQTVFDLPVQSESPPLPISINASEANIMPQSLSPTLSRPSTGPRRPSVTFKSRTPSPKEIEVPIGERARKTSKRWSFNMGAAAEMLNQATPGMFKRTSGQHSPSTETPRRPMTRTQRDAIYQSPPSPESDFTESTIHNQSPPRSPLPRRPSAKHADSALSFEISTKTSDNGYSVWMPSTSSQMSDEEDGDNAFEHDRSTVRPQRPSHIRTSSTPSRDLPTIPKMRKTSPPHTPRSDLSSKVSRDAPSSAPGKLQKVVGVFKKEVKPVASPKSATQTQTRPKSGLFSAPNFLKRNRRTSSPLKREYAPSLYDLAASEHSDIDLSDGESITSYNSIEEEKKSHVPVHRPLPQPLAPASIGEFSAATPPQSLASISGPSLQPSNSASQGPYRSTPHQPGAQVTKTVASIFSWSDRGAWDALHPVEILVVVSPGMIEAFSVSEAFEVPAKAEDGSEISPFHHGVMPLVALELTPLVPLRRGTALDISIRSPPTAASKIKSSNNVMFRSRSPDECEHLYNLINQARINNATYIALQNARPYTEGGTWAAQMERRNQMRSSSGSSGFFGLRSRRGSYRSNSVRKRQVSIAGSDSSVATMNTAFSALRRLSGAGFGALSRFGESTNTTNTDSLSSGRATPARLPHSSADGLDQIGGEGPLALGLGLKEVKIRLYHRESAGKWRDMGSARMSIMLPPTGQPAYHASDHCGLSGASRPGSPRTASASATPTGSGTRTPAGTAASGEKRILVRGKTRGETLLDATLGEGSFERVARTGIAVSVVKDNEGGEGRARDKGGVGASYVDVFMIQMKSERDAAYTFGLVGKLRY